MKEIYEKLDDSLKEKFANIKLIFLDFDGTLTDNKVYVNKDGLEFVKCDRGEGLIIDYVQQDGNVPVCIISREKDEVTRKRAEKLEVDCVAGVFDKLTILKNEALKRNVQLGNICYVGNDLNDIPCIEAVGLGIAVGDAYEQVKKAAVYITHRKGGDGAVREVCELILYAKNLHPFP